MRPPNATGPAGGRQYWTITQPMALPFLMLAVLFRGIENSRCSTWSCKLTGGGPGNITTLTSIDLKREAFEKWRTDIHRPMP